MKPALVPRSALCPLVPFADVCHSICAKDGVQFGRIKQKFTLPIGLPVAMDASADTIKLLRAAVL